MTSQPVSGRKRLPPGFEYIGTSHIIRVRITYVLGDYRETIRRSTKTAKLIDAKRLRHKWEEEARQRALGIAPHSPASRAKLTIAGYFQEFQRDRRDDPKQAGRLERLETLLADIGSLPLGAFTAADAERWKNRRLSMINTWGQKYEKSTVREDCNKVRAFFEAARRAGKIQDNPWRDVELPSGPPKNDEVTTQEQAQLLAALKTDEDRRAVLVLLGTGLRNQEFCRLTLADMVLEGDDPLIDVPDTIGKGGKARIIPLLAETVMVLKAQQAARGLSSLSTEPLWSYQKRKLLWDRICRACERAGMRRLTPKMFRQTYGIRLANTIDVVMPRRFVTQAMGHASEATTEKYYVRTQQEKFRETLRKIDLGLKVASGE